MVNNLGATPPLEMSLVARTALSCLEEQYKVGGSSTQCGTTCCVDAPLEMSLVESTALSRLAERCRVCTAFGMS